MDALQDEFVQLLAWPAHSLIHRLVSVWVNALSTLYFLLTATLMNVFKFVKTVSDNKSAGIVFQNVPTLLSTVHTKSFTWLIVPINFVFYIAQINSFHLLTTKTTNVPKDVPMVHLPTISPNNVFPNVPLYQTTHSHKIHPIFVCSNVQSEVMEAHKICSVF